MAQSSGVKSLLLTIDALSSAFETNKSIFKQAIDKIKQDKQLLELIAKKCIQTNKCNLLGGIIQYGEIDPDYEFKMDHIFGANTGRYDTLLTTSIRYGMIDCVGILLEKGANANKPDFIASLREYPIESATARGKKEIVQLLLDYNANITYKAASSAVDQFDIFQMLLRKNPRHIANLRDENGNSLLHRYNTNDINIVRQILDNGYDIHSANNNGETPLHVRKNLDIIKLFVERGFDIEKRDNDGFTPILAQAARSNPEENILYLIEAGADITATLNDEVDLLCYSVWIKYLNVFNILLDSGIDVNKEYLVRGRRATILNLVNEMIEDANDDGERHLYTQMHDQLLQRGAVALEMPNMPNMPNMPVAQAYEVHAAFAKVNVNEYLNFMKDRVGNKNASIPASDTDLTDYIKSKLNSFIQSPNSNIRGKLNTIYGRHIRNALTAFPTTYNATERILFYYTLEYVSTQSKSFQQNFVKSFAQDCTEAYNDGNRMSCGKGVKERLVLSLESAIASTEVTPEYRRLLNLLDSTKYSMNNDTVSDAEYTRLFNQFASVCMRENTTKNAFIACMKSKMQEELGSRYNDAEFATKIGTYVSSIGNNSFALNTPAVGGKRRNRTRKGKRRNRTRKAKGIRRRSTRRR
jgi:ankyrin repeat protein